MDSLNSPASKMKLEENEGSVIMEYFNLAKNILLKLIFCIK